MKLLFENTTKYTQEIYNTFLEFHSKKFGFSYVLYNVISIALILFCIVMLVAYHYLTIAIFLCCILTGFILWRYLHPIMEVSKEFNSEKIQKETSFTFKFYKTFFTCQDDKFISKIKYYKLRKVFETDNFFYLYIDRNHSFLIDKSKFKYNNSSDFSNFIKKKLWFNYKNYSSKKVNRNQ